MKKGCILHFLIGLSALLLATGLPERAEAANKRANAPKSMALNNAKKPSRKPLVSKVRKQVSTPAMPEELFVNGRMVLGSASALVLDQMSGKAILEKNASTIVPIASISKLMAAIVILDANLDMEEIIQITDEDVDHLRGSGSRLPVGLAMTRDTALLLALMSSENRAASALGRNYPGGMNAFVAAMNRKARDFGLRHTYFVEPTGLSAQNVSTAYDLARLVMIAHQYPKIREYSTMASVELDIGKRVLIFNNTNALVKNETWQIGVSKTGYISEAGRCLVMQAWVADKPVVMVLLDSSGKMTRVVDATRIRRWMESNLASRPTGA
ncbi:MAG: serine hydrolase [Zoogloeaceae bacterium]|jgi:D-alanyl-D-alanine endopeptidase (penicillin-binding protein 7)|nr:serine hydrolase [Zoogloeaceae bacterium]